MGDFLKDFHFYFITDSKRDIISDVRTAIEEGVKIVQYRDKDSSKEEILNNAMALRKLTIDNDVLLIINDHVDIAKEVDADGVHVGQDDMPIEKAREILGDKIIGISTHSLDQAIDAEKRGADYIGIGPIFKTTTKDYKEIGLEVITKVKNSVKVPFIAIGGIDRENIDKVLEAGASRVAIISALLNEEFVDNLKYFKEKLGGM